MRFENLPNCVAADRYDEENEARCRWSEFEEKRAEIERGERALLGASCSAVHVAGRSFVVVLEDIGEAHFYSNHFVDVLPERFTGIKRINPTTAIVSVRELCDEGAVADDVATMFF